jgi:hypothetical protein
MRHYQRLDDVHYDESSDTLTFTCKQEHGCASDLWFGREGMYLSISAQHGPLEIALRPRLRDLTSSLADLKPTEHLGVMRMVGTGQAHVELGLSTNGELLIRTSIIADATGHFAMNTILSSEARERLFEWLGITNTALDS